MQAVFEATFSKKLVAGAAFGTIGYLTYNDYTRYTKMADRFARGSIFGPTDSYETTYFPRLSLESKLTNLLKPSFTYEYGIVHGEVGSGKTRTLVEIIKKRDSKMQLNKLEVVILVIFQSAHCVYTDSCGDAEKGIRFKGIKLAYINNDSEYHDYNCQMYEMVQNNIKCTTFCAQKDYCFYYTLFNSKCLICAVITTAADSESSLQQSSDVLLEDTYIYYKDQMRLNITYQLTTTSGTRNNMLSECRGDGGDLVSFSSYKEFEKVTQFIDESSRGGDLFWTNLRKQADNSWGFYDGSPEIVEIWKTNEPNGDGVCAHMTSASQQYKLNDCGCDYDRYGVCEFHNFSILN